MESLVSTTSSVSKAVALALNWGSWGSVKSKAKALTILVASAELRQVDAGQLDVGGVGGAVYPQHEHALL
jgi:hypothetical protein